MSDNALTADDLPTLRRLATHYRTRAPRRRRHGRIVCHALAAICDRTIRTIERHGQMRPEVDYVQMDRRSKAKR